MRDRVVVAIAVVAALSSAACSRQQDCERALSVLRENHAAMRALHQQLQRMNPQNTSERVHAERLAEEIRDVAKTAEKLTVETEILRGSVSAYRDGLKQATTAAAETSRHATALSRLATAFEKDDAAVAAAIREVEGACPEPRGQCADVKASLDAANSSEQPKDMAAVAAAMKAKRTRLEALKIDDAGLAKAVQALARAIATQEKDSEASDEALKGLEASSKAFGKGLDSAGEAHRSIEAICQ